MQLFVPNASGGSTRKAGLQGERNLQGRSRREGSDACRCPEKAEGERQPAEEDPDGQEEGSHGQAAGGAEFLADRQNGSFGHGKSLFHV